jgi:hypothetical protein
MLNHDFTEYAWNQDWKFVFAKVKTSKAAEVEIHPTAAGWFYP